MQLATKIMSTRRGTLVAALVIALVAAASILLYLSSYRESLKSQGALVTVLVASQDIAKGTAGSVVAAKDLYTVTTIRESQLIEGALSDPASLRERVAVREIFQGAQLTSGDFGAAGDALAPQLTDKQRVVTLPLDSAHGLIGAVEPGNHVDVYAGFNVTPVDANGVPTSGATARPVLRKIITDVPVLAVGEKTRGGGTTNVTLLVDNDGAAKAAFSAEYGKVWLALRPSSGAKATPAAIVTVETLLLGAPSVQMLDTLGGRR